MPAVRPAESKAAFEAVHRAIAGGLVASCHDLAEGHPEKVRDLAALWQRREKAFRRMAQSDAWPLEGSGRPQDA